MSNFKEIDQELINGTINGCTYAPRVRVLARTQDLLLIWVPGHSVWCGLGGTSYSSTEMRVIKRRDHGWRSLIEGLICEGQRLKQSIFEQYAAQIDLHFGEGFHRLLSTRKTVVVGDNEPFSIYGEMPITGREFGYEKFVEEGKRREQLIEEGVTGIELEMRIRA